MRRRLPRRLLVLVMAAVAAVATLVGLLVDLKATGPWIAGAIAAGVAIGCVAVGSHGRGQDEGSSSLKDVSVAEAAVVVLAAVAGFFVAKTIILNDSLTQTRKDLASARAKPAGKRTFSFFVSAGELDPDPTSSNSDESQAYPRIEPDVSAPPAHKPSLSIGDPVRVTCHVTGPADSLQWYRLNDDTFMNGGVIQQAPHSGQGRPPPCP